RPGGPAGGPPRGHRAGAATRAPQVMDLPDPDAPASDMIELEHVTKKYGAKTAVDDLSLAVGRGELFAFLGPNGAGKTTTIKLMCGLLFPTAGTIRIGGFDLKEQGRQARQLISYVPDQPFLYEKLTGREVLHFIADMYGMPRAHSRNRIEEM